MCKTKTLIYNFTNGAALTECLDDINRNYSEKEICCVNINFLKGYIPHRDNLPYHALIGYVDMCSDKDITINHSISIREIQELVQSAQNIIGQIEVEL